MELYFIGNDAVPTLVSAWDHRSSLHWDWLDMMVARNPGVNFFLTVPSTDLDAGGYFIHRASRRGLGGF